MKIVFVDSKCPFPYDPTVLELRGLGGTEATLVRIASALQAQDRHDVFVVQHNRVDEATFGHRLRYLPFAALLDTVRDADHIIFLTRAQRAAEVRRNAPRATLSLWLHNYAPSEVPLYWQDHFASRLMVICVSRTHAMATAAALRRRWWGRTALKLPAWRRLAFIYNPLDPKMLSVPGIERDPNKYLFTSSPHKGLEQVIEAFRRVHAAQPRARLFIANPGYLGLGKNSELEIPGVVKLGVLPHNELMQHLKEACCVFYPQRKRPETFGLVYSESNALGTPVLAHDFGAAREILHPANPPLDTSESSLVIDTVSSWSAGGAPIVSARPEFSLLAVIDNWNKYFESPDEFAHEFWRHQLSHS